MEALQPFNSTRRKKQKQPQSRRVSKEPVFQTFRSFFPNAKIELQGKWDLLEKPFVFYDGWIGNIPAHNYALSMAKYQQYGMQAGEKLFSEEYLKNRIKGMNRKEKELYFQGMFDLPDFSNDGRSVHLSSKISKKLLVGGAHTLNDILQIYHAYKIPEKTIPFLELLQFLQEERSGMTTKQTMIDLLNRIYSNKPVALFLLQHTDTKNIRIEGIPAEIVGHGRSYLRGRVPSTPARIIQYENLEKLNLIHQSEYRIRFMVLGGILYALTEFFQSILQTVRLEQDTAIQQLIERLFPEIVHVNSGQKQTILKEQLNLFLQVCMTPFHDVLRIFDAQLQFRVGSYAFRGADLQSNLDSFNQKYGYVVSGIYDSEFISLIHQRIPSFEICGSDPKFSCLATYCFEILRVFGLHSESPEISFVKIPAEERLRSEVRPFLEERINVKQIIPDYTQNPDNIIGGDETKTETQYLYMYKQYHPYLDLGIDAPFTMCAVMSQAAYLPSSILPYLFAGTSPIRYLGAFRGDPLWTIEGESKKHYVHVWYHTYVDETLGQQYINVYICFRGSHTSRDWREIDFGIMQNTAQFYDERVRDFPTLFQDILQKLSQKEKSSKHLKFFSTGHSLGGFLALMLSYYSQSGFMQDYSFPVENERTATYSISSPYITPIVFNPFCGPKSTGRILTPIETCFTWLPCGHIFRVGNLTDKFNYDYASEIFRPDFNEKTNLHIYQILPAVKFKKICGGKGLKACHAMYQFLGSLWIHTLYVENRPRDHAIVHMNVFVRPTFREPTYGLVIGCADPLDGYNNIHIPVPTIAAVTSIIAPRGGYKTRRSKRT